MALDSTDPVVQTYARAVARRTVTPIGGDATLAGTNLTRRTVTGSGVNGQGAVDPTGISVIGVNDTNLVGRAQGAVAAAQGGGAPITGTPAGPAAPPSADSGGGWTIPGLTDPSWTAVSRGYQLQSDTANQNAALQRAQIQANSDNTRPQYQYQGELQRRDISNDSEGRGILRSGEMQRNLADQMRQEQQRMADLDLQTTGQLGAVDQALSSQQADLRRRFTEAGQSAASAQQIREGTLAAQQAALNGTPTATSNSTGFVAKNSDGSVANGGAYIGNEGAIYTVRNGAVVWLSPEQAAVVVAQYGDPIPLGGQSDVWHQAGGVK